MQIFLKKNNNEIFNANIYFKLNYSAKLGEITSYILTEKCNDQFIITNQLGDILYFTEIIPRIYGTNINLVVNSNFSIFYLYP
jgi:hypothetical protein